MRRRYMLTPDAASSDDDPGAANRPGGRFRGRTLDLREPTEPAGRPSFLGRPTGLLILGGALGSIGFFPLPLGLPGLRFTGTCGVCSSALLLASPNETPATPGVPFDPAPGTPPGMCSLTSPRRSDCVESIGGGWEEGNFLVLSEFSIQKRLVRLGGTNL
jgi:hypothetical protein